MRVIVNYTDSLDRTEYKNVLQVDYIQLEERQYTDRILTLSLLLEVDKEKKTGKRYNVDLKKNVTVIMLNE